MCVVTHRNPSTVSFSPASARDLLGLVDGDRPRPGAPEEDTDARETADLEPRRIGDLDVVDLGSCLGVEPEGPITVLVAELAEPAGVLRRASVRIRPEPVAGVPRTRPDPDAGIEEERGDAADGHAVVAEHPHLHEEGRREVVLDIPGVLPEDVDPPTDPAHLAREGLSHDPDDVSSHREAVAVDVGDRVVAGRGDGTGLEERDAIGQLFELGAACLAAEGGPDLVELLCRDFPVQEDPDLGDLERRVLVVQGQGHQGRVVAVDGLLERHDPGQHRRVVVRDDGHGRGGGDRRLRGGGLHGGLRRGLGGRGGLASGRALGLLRRELALEALLLREELPEGVDAARIADGSGGRGRGEGGGRGQAEYGQEAEHWGISNGWVAETAGDGTCFA